jgi:uncharacterized protein YbjT (DUF2867 family)
MRILITGANGFIGSHVAAAARAAGHQVTHALRPVNGVMKDDAIACDFLHDTQPSTWKSRLTGFDAVINTVGVLRASADAHHRVHAETPAAIAAACADLRKPFLHVSMLGLDRAASSAADTSYFQSKREGEAAIRAVNAGAIIVRPSLVFGPDSEATKLMLLQADMPVLLAPKQSGKVAPIHVDDVAELILNLVGTVRALGCDVDVVGTTELSMDAFIATLRRLRGHTRPAFVLHVPNALLRVGLHVTAALGMKTIVPEALALLEHEHTGDAHMFVRWQRRAPRPVTRFLPPATALKTLGDFVSH